MITARNIQTLQSYLEREMGQTFIFDLQEGWFGSVIDLQGEVEVLWSGFMLLVAHDTRNLHLHYYQHIKINIEDELNPDAFFSKCSSYSIPSHSVCVAVNPHQAIFPLEHCDNFLINRLCRFHVKEFKHRLRRGSVTYRSNEAEFGVKPYKIVKILLKGANASDKERRKLLRIQNNGYRNRLVHAMGKAFLINSQLIDENRYGKLIQLSTGQKFLCLVDPSTGLMYFLRVPESIEGVEEGRAWSFGLTPEEWSGMIEES